MKDVQYKMLENLSNSDNYIHDFSEIQFLINIENELNNEKGVIIGQITERQYLGEYALGITNEEISKCFQELIDGGFIQGLEIWNKLYNTPTFYKLTPMGIDLYNKEYNLRNQTKIRDDEKLIRENELFQAQLENIYSTNKVNGFQNIVAWSIGISTFFTAINSYLAYRQLSLAETQLKVKELTNLQISYQQTKKGVRLLSASQTTSQKTDSSQSKS